MKNKILLTLFVLVMLKSSLGQSIHSTPISSNLQKTSETHYPRVVNYFSFILPILSINNSSTTWDFSNGFQSFEIAFPVGINVLYSKHFGFSYEISPTLKNSALGFKTSSVSFNPGPMFRFDHGFTIIPRLAFSTSGRFGFTPVFNKIFARTKFANYFFSLSLPARFGNNASASIGLSTQFGLIFN